MHLYGLTLDKIIDVWEVQHRRILSGQGVVSHDLPSMCAPWAGTGFGELVATCLIAL